MKNLVYFIIFCILLVVVYIAFGFVINDYNSSRWSTDSRLFMVFIDVVIAYVAVMLKSLSK